MESRGMKASFFITACKDRIRTKKTQNFLAVLFGKIKIKNVEKKKTNKKNDCVKNQRNKGLLLKTVVGGSKSKCMTFNGN